MTTYREVERLCGEIRTLRYSQTIANKKALQYLGVTRQGKGTFIQNLMRW